MISPFSFFTATTILFGRGQAQQAAGWLNGRARRILLVHGASAQRAAWLLQDLQVAGMQISTFSVAREPVVEIINQGMALAREQQVEAVISLGGGAVLDAGKAIAALAVVPGPVTDYLEVVGCGRRLEQDPLPFIAIPTTAGTGAEVTKNAVIGVPEHQRKVSLRDNRMLARLAIVDPALMDHAPRNVTLYSGLDALTQVIEPYLCRRPNPLTDALCTDAIPRAMRALLRLSEQECADSRDELAWASLCGGLALTNAGLGVVHGLAGPLGGLSDAPHGALCGVLLPYALEMNHSHTTTSKVRQRIEQVLALLANCLGVVPDQACTALRQWSHRAGLHSLHQIGVSASILAPAAQAACQSSSMQANPVTLSQEQLLNLLQQAWQG